MTPAAPPMPGIATDHAGAAPPADDLAALVRAFEGVTLRLQATHEQLRAEVERLTRELGEANERLERSRRLAALGEMAAGIAHEVRTPLASIALYAGHLHDDLADRPPERATAAKIAAAARELEGIVTDVLAFAQGFRVRPEPVPVPALFDRALDAAAPPSDPLLRGVRVRRDDRTDGPLVVRVDPGLMVRALSNVIRNALQAMREAPTPTEAGAPPELVLSAMTLPASGANPDAGEVALRVRDTGPGIPPDVRARMFNPFFTTRAAGAGLGLAIVHRIAEAHEGRVRVSNNDEPGPRASGGGPGATVEIVIPAFEPPEAT